MKNNKVFMRMFAVLMAALVMMGGFSVTAYAGGGSETGETEPERLEAIEETTVPHVPEPLTPEGNMSLVDDIDDAAVGDKQFITVITQSGNTFYIIIDRAEDGENTVHFLNKVDEADLMALIESGEIQTQPPVAPTPDPEPPVVSEPEPEPESEKSGGMGGVLVILLLLALAGGSTFYYFKVMKPKQSAKGSSNLEDYDFEDDEDEEYETEIIDLEEDTE